MSEYSIDSILKKAHELGASDLHFSVGEVPSFRIDGKIIKSKLPPVTDDDMMEAIDTMAPVSMRDKIFRSYDSDFPYEIENVSRFRVNLAMSFGYHSMTVRMIPFDIPSLNDLNLPKNLEKALVCDSAATVIGSVLGTSNVTTYVESSVGIEAGGRTGLTALSAALCFGKQHPCLQGGSDGI